MSLLDLFSSEIKIRSIKNEPCIKYIIEYPKKKGAPVDISMDIFKNVLKDSGPVILVDSALSFLSANAARESIKSLRNILRNKDIYFDFRAAKSEEKSGLAGLLFGKKSGSKEMLAFKLAKGFDDDEIVKSILNIGCMVYVPIVESEGYELVDQVFNGYFEDDEDRFSTFKFIMYINSSIDRASIDTRNLDVEDIKKLYVRS